MSVHGWLAGSSQPGRGGAEVSLQAGCGERAGSRAAVAARGWPGVPTQAREAREGPRYAFFCDIEMLPAIECEDVGPGDGSTRQHSAAQSAAW